MLFRSTIVVKTNERRLYLILDSGHAMRYPVGVGKSGKQWAGTTRIDGKYRNPAWSPPAEVKRDKPSIPNVIAGGSPANPMGVAAMTLAGGEYAIHGTNATFGIGLRVSSGCVRLRADDIKYLFDHVPVGTRVQFVNQPVKTTVEPDGGRYMEVHEPLSRTEEEFNSTASVPLPMTPATTRFIAHADSDSNVVKQVLEQRTGIPTRLNPEA